MDRKAVKCILIGYGYDEGYRISCEEEKILIRSRNVTFEEKIIHNKKMTIPTQINLYLFVNQSLYKLTQEILLFFYTHKKLNDYLYHDISSNPK